MIVVDYEALEQSRRSLASIGDEFENSVAIRDRLAAQLGSGEVAEAMRDFTQNWDRRCQALTGKIRDTERAVGSVMASFSAQDRAAASFDLSRQAGPMMSTTETGR